MPKLIFRLTVLLTIALLTVTWTGVHFSSVQADEVVLDEYHKDQLGDFECSICPQPIDSSIEIIQKGQRNDKAGIITAGELWRFFDSKGVEKLDRLVLCVDVEPVAGKSKFDLASFRLQIDDPENPNKLLTDVSLGDNSLVVPTFATTAYKPEAQMEFQLDYNFMEMFGPDSQEKISLNLMVDGESTQKLSVVIPATKSGFSLGNPIFLFLFSGFWLALFFVLFKMTAPERRNKGGQALSPSQ